MFFFLVRLGLVQIRSKSLQKKLLFKITLTNKQRNFNGLITRISAGVECPWRKLSDADEPFIEKLGWKTFKFEMFSIPDLAESYFFKVAQI
jgi:hypothetical protein